MHTCIYMRKKGGDAGSNNRVVIEIKMAARALVLLYVQEVVTQPEILNRTILSNRVHVT